MRPKIHPAATLLREIYVSTDIEADGPIPGPNSMLSFGSVAFFDDRTEVGTFTRNLETLEGSQPDPSTQAWWAKQPEAWAACRRDLVPPRDAMQAYAAWLHSLPGKPTFVGYPATYDFMFIHWYLMKFVGQNPMSFSGLDIKTLAMALLRCEFRHATKRNMPKHWFEDVPHTHVALDDAREQGLLFLNMLKQNRKEV